MAQLPPELPAVVPLVGIQGPQQRRPYAFPYPLGLPPSPRTQHPQDAIEAFKVWSPQGEVIYAYRSDLVGLRYPENTALKQALSGVSVADFTKLDAPENTLEPQAWRGFLEVYAPVHDPQTTAVLGVVEFYQRADGFRRKIVASKARAGMALGGLATVDYATTFFAALWFPKRAQSKSARSLA